MITLEAGAYILLVIVALIISARNTATKRAKIKEQVNREYDEEVELTRDELESRLGEAEILYEDLEQTYWVHVGVLIGIATYFYGHIWYLSVAIGVGVIIVGYKFLSLKPFSTAMPDR